MRAITPALAALAMSAALAGCAATAGVEPGAGAAAQRSPAGDTLFEPSPAPVPRFYFGADLSYVNEMEDCGAVYRVDGRPMDAYRLFEQIGTNLVRVRIWNDADWTPYSDLDDVKETIRRSKAAGMQVLLDFHYSDDWADGDHQVIPRAWLPIKDDVPALSQALYDYTFDTLMALDAEGLMPEMVQVGNETNGELMGMTSRSHGDQPDPEASGEAGVTPGGARRRAPTNWTRNAALFNAGVRAVRDAGARATVSDIRPRIMLHVAQPENVEPWFEKAEEFGVTGYDLIGISYYHRWSKMDLAGLKGVIERLRARYPDRDVIVVEAGYPFTLENADPAGNLLGEPLLPGYPATPEGQLKFLTDLTQTTIDAGGVGMVTWEPAWVSTGCKTRWATGSDWENATYFDWKRGNELLPGGRWAQAEYRWPQ